MLLEGNLILTLTDGASIHGRFVSAPLAVKPGRNRYRIVLPSIEGRSTFDSVDVIARFVTEDGDEIKLGSRPMRITSPTDRIFRVTYCDPVAKSLNSELNDFLKTLHFEQFFKPETNTRASDTNLFTVATATAIVAPQQFPEDPHWHCVSNIVVLSSDGFAALRINQLKALRQWVRSGGSLCIEPLSVLEERHVEFLNELAGKGDDAPFVSEQSGRIGIPQDRHFDLIRSGLGRIVVVYRRIDSELDFKSPEWLNAVTFLWSFRTDQMTPAREDGSFKWLPPEELSPNENQVQNVQHDPYGYRTMPIPNGTSLLAIKPIHSGQSLVERLMPQDVKVVPLPYIGAILFFYVLTIGPLDYFVLGALKLRRFTWVTFPLATVAFTLFTVWLSHSFLGSSTERTVVDINDYDDSGRIVRRNSLGLLFTMSSHDVNTQLHSALFTPLDHSRFGGHLRDQFGQNVTRRNVPAPTVSGRPPGNYVAVQAVPQWTPQLNRIFKIAPDEDPLLEEQLPEDQPEYPNFDWKKARELSKQKERDDLRDEIQQAFGPNAVAVLFNRRDAHQLFGQRQSVFTISRVRFYGNTSTGSYDTSEGYSDFLWDISARLQGKGIFGVISQIAPHGGDNFEDLTILDPSDSRQWLLVVVTSDSQDVQIYRRLYHVTAQEANQPQLSESQNTESQDQPLPIEKPQSEAAETKDEESN